MAVKAIKVNHCLTLLLLFGIGVAVYRNYEASLNLRLIRQAELRLEADSYENVSSKKTAEDDIKTEEDCVRKFYTEERRKLRLEDIHITVKTTKKNLMKRMQFLLDTWVPKAKSQVYIITDELDEQRAKMKQFNWVTTKCGSRHKWGDLSCKTAAEYKTFKDNPKKWWCHLDDDIYLNPSRLVSLLRQYEWRDWYYIGRLSRPSGFNANFKGKDYHYLFAHGGAYCVSGSLAKKIAPWLKEEVFVDMSVSISRGDDVTMGLIVNGMLGVSVTEPVMIHTHAENQTFIDPNRFRYDATFNYAGSQNLISFGREQPRFSVKEDPTRFKSLHCYIYPKDNFCIKKGKIH